LIKAPFPWFGGKSRVAHLVWQHFGDVPNYVEPFAGSLAVLLARPTPPGIETVNDLDCYLANFWRATSHAAESVAQHADHPVNEADLHARHLWLVQQDAFRERMKTDPDYYDVRIAGWWVWGLSQWIGAKWCDVGAGRPHRRRPHLRDVGTGVHRATVGDIYQYFQQLQDRLRNVRVCCGDWSRVLGPTPTFVNGITGIMLDPPYAAERDDIYSEESFTIAHDVRQWALENGDNLRIALCGYAGEHDDLVHAGWKAVAWRAHGGYGNQSSGRGRENKHNERIWFSPHCIHTRQTTLFQP
jgi:site-specific DNA-adenine methylase